MIVVNETGRRRVLASYVTYYMRSPTYLALAKVGPRAHRTLLVSSCRDVRESRHRDRQNSHTHVEK